MGNSIPHIRLCSPKQLLDIANHLFDVETVVSEKVDGVNAVFGRDEDSKLYVSRELKNGERYFSVQDIQNSATGAKWHLQNLFSHVLAIDSNVPIPKGSSFECEMLYGDLPNIIYYSNPGAIVILNTNDLETAQKIERYDTLTGQSTQTLQQSVFFNGFSESYTKQQRVTLRAFNLRRTPFLSHVSENKKALIELFLSRVKLELLSFDKIYGMPIQEAFDLKLNKGPVSERPRKREIREAAQDLCHQLGSRVTDFLINSGNVIPTTSTYSIEPPVNHNLTEIEGIVVELSNGFRFKVVNTERFTTLNRFYHGLETQIVNTFIPKKVDFGSIIPTVFRLNRELSDEGSLSLYSCFLRELGNGNVWQHSNLKKAVNNYDFLDGAAVKKLVERYIDHVHVIADELECMKKEKRPQLFIDETILAYDCNNWSRVWQSLERFHAYLSRLQNFIAVHPNVSENVVEFRKLLLSI